MVCLHIILPRIEAGNIAPPTRCRSRTCGGTRFRLHQQVAKPLRDRTDPAVVVHRYRCLTCGRTFRVYPHGVTRSHTSLRVRDLAVLLYQLGLSYAEVSTALESWKVYLCKSQVYQAVQAASDTAPQRGAILQGIRTQPVGKRPPLVGWQGGWAPFLLMSDDARDLVLTIQLPTKADAEQCEVEIGPIVVAMGAELRLTVDISERRWLVQDTELCQETERRHYQTSNARSR